MSDPLSMANLSATALTEGIKFLYEQAGELLKRRRDRAGAGATETPSIVAQPATLPTADPELVRQYRHDLRRLRSDLEDYVSGRSPVAASDNHLVDRTEALRRVVENIYGVPVFFAGESDQAPKIRSSIDAGPVEGTIIGVQAEQAEGTIKSDITVDTVHKDAEVYGVVIGSRSRRRR
jgi:hypothetical protein